MAHPHPIAESIVPERTSVDSGKELNVVLLEDDAADAEMFLAQLVDAWPAGVRLTVCTSVTELEAELPSMDPEVVFCDLTLPDGSGVEVVDRVLASAVAPVIVLTGSTDPEIAMVALERGAEDYLHKAELSCDSLARSLRYSIARGIGDRETRRIANDLRQINRDLDQFAGVVAHDLRAPVRTARLLADRLVAETMRGNDGNALATALDGSLERMELLIEHLLKMASLRDHSIRPESELLSVIVADIHNDLLADIRETNAKVRCISDGSVFADPTLVRELLRNLVHNCIQFRSPDRDPHVALSVSSDGRQTHLVVADNGIGVPEARRERVFGLFEQSTSDGPASAVGFGLTLVRQITELHTGSIVIEPPATAVGTQVRITLPTGAG